MFPADVFRLPVRLSHDMSGTTLMESSHSLGQDELWSFWWSEVEGQGLQN